MPNGVGWSSPGGLMSRNRPRARLAAGRRCIVGVSRADDSIRSQRSTPPVIITRPYADRDEARVDALTGRSRRDMSSRTPGELCDLFPHRASPPHADDVVSSAIGLVPAPSRDSSRQGWNTSPTLLSLPLPERVERDRSPPGSPEYDARASTSSPRAPRPASRTPRSSRSLPSAESLPIRSIFDPLLCRSGDPNAALSPARHER